MNRQPPPSNSQRFGVLATVVLLHAALLVAFIASREPAPPSPVQPGAFSLISIAAALPAQRPPPPPRLPSKVVDEIKRLTQDAPTFEPDSSALAARSGQCATLNEISQAIIASPAAVTAVVQAPPETRSIAEAIVMWNAGWSSAASSPNAPLGAARSVVEQSLSSVDDGCLDEQIAGPRLIAIPVEGGRRTMFLVFGSGTWTWRELLDGPIDTVQIAPAEEQAEPWFDFDWR